MGLGDITSLCFFSDKYLVSTSADGTLALFRTKDWSLLRKFKGHKVAQGPCNFVETTDVSSGPSESRCRASTRASRAECGQRSMSANMGSARQRNGKSQFEHKAWRWCVYPTFGLDPVDDGDFAEAHLVRWNAQGDRFAVLFDHEIRAYGVVSSASPLFVRCSHRLTGHDAVC